MKSFSRLHLTDVALRRVIAEHHAGEHDARAEALADLGEYDARKLYVPDGFPSMVDYCMHELRMTRPVALKRIRVARLAREFPEILQAIACGSLHLTGVIQLSPCLTTENVDELLMAATGKTELEIVELLASRVPKPDAQSLVSVTEPVSARRLDEHGEPTADRDSVPAPTAAGGTSISEEWHPVQYVWRRSGQEKLQRARELHPGTIGEVIERALEVFVAHLEKRKFAATSKPREPRACSSRNPRYVPAHVRRQVRERDGDQCTFVSDTGRRCVARTRLEFDHAVEIARGGQATVSNLRLRCRTHNQYTAERTFGAGFMERKREAARRAAAERATVKAQAVEHKRAAAEARATEKVRAAEEARLAAEAARAKDVTPWLRELGFRGDDLRRASAHCESMPDASLEDRAKAALSFLAPNARKWSPEKSRNSVTTAA